MSTIANRVQAGLDWIAEHGSEYGVNLDRVNLDTLDVASPQHCVLGQAVTWSGDARSGYSIVTNELLVTGLVEDVYQWALDHGFAPYARLNDDAMALTAEWKRRLGAGRRPSAGRSPVWPVG